MGVQFGGAHTSFVPVPEGQYILWWKRAEVKEIDYKGKRSPKIVHYFGIINPPPEGDEVDFMTDVQFTPKNAFGKMLKEMIPGFVEWYLSNNAQQFDTDVFTGCFVGAIVKHRSKDDFVNARIDAFYKVRQDQLAAMGYQHAPVQSQYAAWDGRAIQSAGGHAQTSGPAPAQTSGPGSAPLPGAAPAPGPGPAPMPGAVPAPGPAPMPGPMPGAAPGPAPMPGPMPGAAPGPAPMPGPMPGAAPGPAPFGPPPTGVTPAPPAPPAPQPQLQPGQVGPDGQMRQSW